MQSFPFKSMFLFLGFVLILSILFLAFSAVAVRTDDKIQVPGIRPGFGWSELAGNQLYIECNESEPRTILSKGFPFIYEQQNTYCQEELAVSMTETNPFGVILNIAVATGVGIGLMSIPRRFRSNRTTA